MRRRTFLRATGGLATSAWLLRATTRAQVSHPDALVAELKTRLPDLMRAHRVPGLAIALVRDGKMAWVEGFGMKVRDSSQRVDNDTVFEAASVSKTVFAYAVMKLCDEGVIGLDTPLTQYAPTPFLAGDARLNLITARHVLSHTTGFQDWRSRSAPLKIHFDPGERFDYSGEGYFYLQSIMTHLRGRVDRAHCGRFEAGLEVCATDIDETMQRMVLRPFGMAASGYLWNARLEPHVAAPHDIEGRPLTKGKTTPVEAARYASAGGLNTTATDYARFLIEVVAPRPADEHRLKKSTWQEMLRPQIKLPPDVKIDGATHWALGWAIQELASGNLIIHSGGQAGFRSLAIGNLERRAGFVILTNSDKGGNVIYDETILRPLVGMLTT
ncbi:MAG TPA: serine hydrolase domain-containing protein [Opitutaceae bacterium]|nr:serine hydrolase domain-containing protein [Opitutaceae bacterium]